MAALTAESVQFRSALIINDHPPFCEALSMTLTLKAITGIEDIDTAGLLSSAVEMLGAGQNPTFWFST